MSILEPCRIDLCKIADKNSVGTMAFTKSTKSKDRTKRSHAGYVLFTNYCSKPPT
jgi:hypothetical protein